MVLESSEYVVHAETRGATQVLDGILTHEAKRDVLPTLSSLATKSLGSFALYEFLDKGVAVAVLLVILTGQRDTFRVWKRDASATRWTSCRAGRPPPPDLAGVGRVRGHEKRRDGDDRLARRLDGWTVKVDGDHETTLEGRKEGLQRRRQGVQLRRVRVLRERETKTLEARLGRVLHDGAHHAGGQEVHHVCAIAGGTHTPF